jgi:hypothetical protein
MRTNLSINELLFCILLVFAAVVLCSAIGMVLGYMSWDWLHAYQPMFRAVLA